MAVFYHEHPLKVKVLFYTHTRVCALMGISNKPTHLLKIFKKALFSVFLALDKAPCSHLVNYIYP